MNNTDKLERNRACYRDLLTKWLRILTGDHPNAIWRQLDHVVNDEAWFKFVIRLRKQAGNPPVNDHLWNIFITRYGVKQSLAIRRLTDPNSRTASLLGLILAIDRNKSLLTREVMVGHDGTTMDVDALFQQLSSFDGASDDQLAEQQWSDAKYAHQAFDRLRDASPCISRSPSDRVSDEVLGALKDALNSKAILWVRHRCDKYLAHADLSDLANDLTGRVSVCVVSMMFAAARCFSANCARNSAIRSPSMTAVLWGLAILYGVGKARCPARSMPSSPGRGLLDPRLKSAACRRGGLRRSSEAGRSLSRCEASP
jgi:hypothetical protein